MSLGWGQRSNIIKFRLPWQFQRFLYQTLCVLPQMRDIKHVRRDFYFVVWVMPKGWDFGALWGTGGAQRINFFQTWSCGIIKSTEMTPRSNASNIFILGPNWWPWGEVKRSNIINMSILKISIPNFVCILKNKGYKTYWTEFSFCCLGHAPGWDLEMLGESKTSPQDGTTWSVMYTIALMPSSVMVDLNIGTNYSLA